VTAMETPDFYDDLSLSLFELRRIVEQGVQNRRSAAHHPIIANVDPAGAPQQRVMILRNFDWAGRQLRFHTDSRSDKIRQYGTNPETSVLIYDEAAKVQIRLSGLAHADDGQINNQAWAESTPFARRCYLAEHAPGIVADKPTSGLPKWIEGKQPDEEQLTPARPNFTALLVTVQTIEWLYLANAGHRRARWQWNESMQDWSGNWLVP
jgi:pyridoxamine 5'-phosphate oxidase